ncbi:FxLYD domain-containing protein [Phenylobacterium sp. LjRoot225]|uniref:FxLYD domain-containing protein n=1 Tax=Phenylobacterium sp. LjRoot225 TaxID=3342285 RepID=UPI003ECD0458
MIGIVFAAALANSIAAPYGIWARAQWGATRPNVQLSLENRSQVKAWLVDVACNAYDARGALVAVATANVAQLKPGERVETWATAEAEAPAVRFACKVGVSEWQRPD